MIDEYQGFIEQLESLGEQEVISKLTIGQWSGQRKKYAEDWISRKNADKRDAREESTLEEARRSNAIAEEALSIARTANRNAMAAWIAAAVAAIAAIIAAI